MPPILSPQTSLMVAEVHMDEAGTSATPHLSSTSHPGTIRISSKCHRGSSDSLEVDDPLNKVLKVETFDCCEESETSLLATEPNSESQTLQQMSAHDDAYSSEIPTDPLPEISGDETPAKIELAVGTPGIGVTCMDPSEEPSPWVNSSVGPPDGSTSGSSVAPKPQTPL
ncbi:hypothetical protein Hamer_G012121 [Homarus americanus]|uniref:Uncharacterized protein n=1 Tax=Homarus americanus TaxID=6706 RepID=A0A8J5JEB6_HOMAM|nr:hypothetical protein Hamer_G012121 [Homarus americanus]